MNEEMKTALKGILKTALAAAVKAACQHTLAEIEKTQAARPLTAEERTLKALVQN